MFANFVDEKVLPYIEVQSVFFIFSVLNWKSKSENCFPPQNTSEEIAFGKTLFGRLNDCSMIPHFSNLNTFNRKFERQNVKRIKIL